jgi:Uma2 family endonuclease
MTAAEPSLVTVEQYRTLPANENALQELHWGSVVTMTRPKMRHARLQACLARLLRPKAEHLGIVETEVAFRALPEYDLRGADIAYVSQTRWDGSDDDDNLHGSPELVIEILVPSNTKREMQEKAALCLSTGSEEFWVVDPDHHTVSVTHRSGQSNLYRRGDHVPLPLFGSDLSVTDIFS